VGRVFGMYGGEEKCIQVLVGIPEGKRSVEDLVVCVRVIKFDR